MPVGKYSPHPDVNAVAWRGMDHLERNEGFVLSGVCALFPANNTSPLTKNTSILLVGFN